MHELLKKDIITLAQQASAAILKLYKSPDLKILTKPDHTPVTQADFVANDILVNGLRQLTPTIPILSEELPPVAFAERSQWKEYWLLDPLDGTRQFIRQTDQFTINIALIKNNYPVFGLLYVPTIKTCYFAEQNSGAFKQIGNHAPTPIQVRTLPSTPKALISQQQNESKARAKLNMFTTLDIEAVGSALKYGLVAEGAADLYPCTSTTAEWDTAAGQCIVECAGGCIINFNGERLRYNTKSSLINPHFAVLGDSNKLLPLILNWQNE